MAQGRLREDLNADRQFNLAIVRLLQIIGEAAAQVSTTDRQSWPLVPWDDIVGFRNRIVHGYDQIDFDVVWAIVQEDLPKLVVQLSNLLPRTASD